MAIQTFTRVVPADPTQLEIAVKAAVSGVFSIFPYVGIIEVDKSTAWTAPQITAVQSAIDGVPNSSPALTNQNYIDKMPVAEKAILLTMLDQINVLRAALPTPLNPITPAQAIAAVRNKIGTL